MLKTLDSKSKIQDSKAKRLDKIKEEIIKQNICPDLAKAATQIVFGDGNPDAEVVFIGEAPGKQEDEQGLPFVGAAGRFLNEMLESAGLKRSDVYITNIVKYRPPNNRDPYPDEKAAFLPYLKRQLIVIRPKLIVTLGRHSLETLLPGLRISQVHGQPKRIKVTLSGRPGADAMQGSGEQRTELYKDGTAKEQPQPATPQRAASNSGAVSSAGRQAVATWVVLPLFHPAAALYNGDMRQALLDDFAKIPRVLAKIHAPKGRDSSPKSQAKIRKPLVRDSAPNISDPNKLQI